VVRSSGDTSGYRSFQGWDGGGPVAGWRAPPQPQVGQEGVDPKEKLEAG
jgi:hypothetical protein